MDIKNLFNQNKDQGKSENKMDERHVTRMNALEVQVKQLLQFEKQARPLLLRMNQGEREVERRMDPFPSESLVDKKEYDQLLRKVMGLEQKLNHIQTAVSSFQDSSPNQNESREEHGMSAIQEKMKALETNFLLLNEVQAVILKQMTDLSHKLAELSNQTSKAETQESNQEPLFKTLYIDKLFLDKYEQNNNFAQLGIKELSGALNIGATYGKDVVPKAVTEQIQEDVAQMKAMKEQMYQKQPSGQEPEFEDQEDSTEETDIEFTNIQIVDDSSFEDME
ncbi:hypothetical protein [Neobacillus dielmonensis]|uniref:hypothetical protein n=1 Tax=Neobacillus dielmonensis TaxID=1347369 RepID=UPI000693C4C6|nr:hypothetical protein [Neobacillus dielmonensis]